jgi:hypothetical protein
MGVAKILHTFRMCVAECIDGLVLVPNDGQRGASGDEIDELLFRAVEVLIFIHQNVVKLSCCSANTRSQGL